MHRASRASFHLFLPQGGEKEALPESHQLFEGATAQTSGLVKLVFSRQTGFSSVSVSVVIKPMVVIEPAVMRKTNMAARSGLLGLGLRLYPATFSAFSKKIIINPCRVFLKNTKRKAL